MTRFGALLACLALLGSGASTGFAEAGQDGERMISYVARTELGTDGTLSVTERIRHSFSTPGHGDFRVVPRWYSLVRPQQTTDHVRAVEIDYDSATMDGQPVPFAQDRPSPGSVILRVGGADAMTGEHDFELR